MKPFVDEYQQDDLGLVQSGKLKIHSFICDTPARSFIKAIKGHNAYFGCDKCVVEGNYLNRRMSYFETTSVLRTDESFRTKRNEEHHLNETILQSLPNVDMINSFPLDYMHLICLGVVKKILILWTRGRPNEQKLSFNQISAISENLIKISKLTVLEFSRKPRSLTELDRWKATEFRQFLLYTGPIVLKNIVSEDNYNLFLSLSLAVNILSSEQLHLTYNEFAKSLLLYFVSSFKILFGEDRVSYNVHGLIHLSEDVKRFGPLDSFSAFKFENELGKLKKLIRTPNKPLQQIVQRVLEKGLTLKSNKKIHRQYIQLHDEGPILQIHVNMHQYKVIKLAKFTINCSNMKDAFVMLNSKSVFSVRNICCDEITGVVHCVGNFHDTVSPFFSSPYDSSIFNMVKFCTKSEEKIV